MLLDKIDGVLLFEALERINFQSKLRLTRELVDYLQRYLIFGSVRLDNCTFLRFKIESVAEHCLQIWRKSRECRGLR